MSLFIVDVEADGPIPAEFSMVCFGAVLFDEALDKSFYGQTRPASDRFVPEALAISGFSREQHLTFDDPKVVMEKFSAWLGQHANGRPVFVSDNLAFDWQFINYYFHRFLGQNPFGFSGRRIGDLYAGLVRDAHKATEWKKYRITRHTHNPVDDARGNAEALKKVPGTGAQDIMHTFAIGDIHGCDVALTALLRQMRPGPGDQFVFLGDYIDRGPASRAVIDRLLDFATQHRTVFLRGNHELMMLASREDPLKVSLWQSYGGLDTLASYGAEFRDDWAAAVPDSHWAFLQQTARFFETPECLFVHACLDPELDMNDQPDWLLFWEFFDRIQPHTSGKRVICGHSPQRSGLIKDLGFAMCIDTRPASGGWLTCLDTDSRQYWQANEQGEVRTISP